MGKNEQQQQHQQFIRTELFFFVVKAGTPSWYELEELGMEIGTRWKRLGRRLGIAEVVLDEIDLVNEQPSEKACQLLRRWRTQKGSDATYQALYDALSIDM